MDSACCMGWQREFPGVVTQTSQQQQCHINGTNAEQDARVAVKQKVCAGSLYLHSRLKEARAARQHRLHALRRDDSRMRPAVPPAAQPCLKAPPQHCVVRVVVHLQGLPTSALAQHWSLNAPCQATTPQKSQVTHCGATVLRAPLCCDLVAELHGLRPAAPERHSKATRACAAHAFC